MGKIQSDPPSLAIKMKHSSSPEEKTKHWHFPIPRETQTNIIPTKRIPLPGLISKQHGRICKKCFKKWNYFAERKLDVFPCSTKNPQLCPTGVALAIKPRGIKGFAGSAFSKGHIWGFFDFFFNFLLTGPTSS